MFYNGMRFSAAKEYCKKNNVINRLGHRFAFSGYRELKQKAITFNHRVVKIEFYGYEDVYNLTIDDNHNYFIITSNQDERFITSSGICVANCGETNLKPYSACNLGSINLTKIIKEGKIDWNKFEKLIY